uniref:Kelch repeat-containing protein n=1 Tax=Oryza glumipatula TaxID=40148 RepID=A0A0D9ZME2_9ORYZ
MKKKKRPYCPAPILHDRLVLLSSLRCTCRRRLAVKCHRHTPLLAAAAAASDHPAMARPAATAAAPKAPPPKHLIVLAVVAILGLVLVADFLWASSSPAAPAWSSRIDLPGRPAALVPPSGKKICQHQNYNGRRWLKHLCHVHSHVDIYNFSDNTWGGRFDMPKEMAHSHLGMVTDGRYVYVVTGQYGPQCRGPTARNFVLDTETKEWHDLPPLPVPRYAPATQLWRGRLHVMGGSKEDRHKPGLEHWSIAVKDGKALENEWRSEIPIPRGGPHRACVVANDKLLVIGGQEGDFMAKPGSPIFKCVRRSEVVYSNVYMLDDGMKWKEFPPMPKPDSHIEFAWVNVNNSLIIAGGTTEKHPITKKMVLVGEVFRFNLNTLEWTVIGRLPFRIKTTLVGYWDGWLYFTSGQRDKGPKDPSPKKVVGCMWRTKLHL